MKNVIWGLIALILVLLGMLYVPSKAHAANCPSNPYTLTNGQTADATQVMANFNSLLACTNNNLAHSGANSDITSISGLSTPLSVSQGGTGSTTDILAGFLGTANIWTAKQTYNISEAALVFKPMAPGDSSYILWTDGGTNTQRWTLGNNAAGFLFINRYDSSGNFQDRPLAISPTDGSVTGKLPFEFYAFVGGVTGNAWTLANYNPSTALILTTAKSACTVGTAATGTTTYTLKDNGSSIGTAVITAGTTTCTATITSSPYSFTSGHTLSISGPATGDATAADVGMTFGGTRN